MSKKTKKKMLTSLETRELMISWLTKNAEVSLIAEPEMISVRGNALASGDDAEDRACEQAIEKRLDAGDLWAWCCVTVVVEWRGFKATDHLGACSYEDEKDFRQPGGYFDDMVRTAAEQIVDQLEQAQRDRADLRFMSGAM